MSTRPQAGRQLERLHEHFAEQGYDVSLALILAAVWIGCCLRTSRLKGLPADEMMEEVMKTIQEAYDGKGETWFH